MNRFFFLEPSKVGSQHITLIDGYLRALVSSERLKVTHELTLCASRSTYNNLSPDLRSQVRHETVAVMNPENRRLAPKTFLEFFVILRYLLRMRNEDVLFISCALPTTILLLELINKLVRRSNFHICLHGELEGLFDKSVQHVRSYGFWILLWIKIRTTRSRLSLVVLDEFIKRRLLAEFPHKLSSKDITVIYHPITPFSPASGLGSVSACFIGYRTRFKGFEQFELLAQSLPGVRFVEIGGGRMARVPKGSPIPISSNQQYMNAISDCSVAIFPYVGGYSCSLSAAVLDALSAGVHVLATPRDCFLELSKHLGPEAITIYHAQEEAHALLKDPDWISSQRRGRIERRQRLKESRYSLANVQRCFEGLLPSRTAY